MRISFLIFLLLQFAGLAYAQTEADSSAVKYDSSRIVPRTISAQKIETFRNDSDFDYGQGMAEGVSLWDRIRYWLIRLWQTLFGESISGTIIEFVFYLLCLIGLVYVILKLLDVDATRLFYRKEKGGDFAFTEGIHDNIHGINFEVEIQKALEVKDFRTAIRLRYLFALRQLADQQLIRWQPGKTNTEYLQEVPSALQSALYDLNYYYNYTWYGNFPAHENLYRYVEKTFHQLAQTVTAKA